MARAAVVPLLFIGLIASFCRAEDQDATATVRPSSSKERSEADLVVNQSINHLLHVADHLEQAGHADEAARIRVEARELAQKSNILSRKEAELECLLDEVDRLRKLTGDSQTVLLRLVAIEVDRTRLGDRAAEFDRLFTSPGRADQDEGGVVEQASGRGPGEIRTLAAPIDVGSPLFQELRHRRAVAIIAEPTLITTNRRPGSFLSGGQFAVPLPPQGPDEKPAVQWKTFGVQMEFVPTVRAGGRMRLQTKFEFSEKDLRNSYVVEGTAIPGLTTRGVNTVVDVHSGQTVVIGKFRSVRPQGQAQVGVAEPLEKMVHVVGVKSNSTLTGEIVLAEAPGDAKESELIVVITPELVHLPHRSVPLQPVPIEEEIEILRKTLVPNKLMEDLQYFPATPIFRKGTAK